MLTSLSSNAITAKCKAIYGKRLTNADYHELLRQRSVADVAAYLKNSTSYSAYLSSVEESQIHRGQLEHLLERSLFDKFTRLTHYDFSKGRGFYHYAVSHIEVSFLIEAIILLNANKPQEIILKAPTTMQKYFCFDMMKLSRVTSFSGLLDALRGTAYYSVLRHFDAPNGSIDLSRCEQALKEHYYKSILQSIEKNYRGKTRRELKEVILIEIELINLSLIFRLKTYFKRPPEEIKRELLPFSYKLNKKAMDILIGAESDQDFISKMHLSSYSNKMQAVEFNYIEDYTKRLKFIIGRKLVRSSTKAPIAFYSLITLLQVEIDNLKTIIEGIRYQNSPSEIEKLLILE